MLRLSLHSKFGQRADSALSDFFIKAQKVALIEGLDIVFSQYINDDESLSNLKRVSSGDDISSLFVGLSFGLLVVSSAAKNGNDFDLVLSCKCGGTLDATLSSLAKTKIISCGGSQCFCQSTFDKEICYNRAQRSAESRCDSVWKNAKLYSKLRLAHNIRASIGSESDDGRYKYPHKAMLDEIFKERIKSEWLFDSLDHILGTVGWPLYDAMELHRVDHDKYGEAVPYGPLTTVWMDAEANRGLHVSNTVIKTPSGKFESLRAAVLALHADSTEAGTTAYNRLRTRIRRARKAAEESGESPEGIDQREYDAYRAELK